MKNNESYNKPSKLLITILYLNVENDDFGGIFPLN